MTSAEIQELFNRTLIGDYEDESAWEAVEALRQPGCRETFEIAAGWLRDEEPLKRARAADILAQLREPGSPPAEKLFRDEAYALIIEMLEAKTEPLVISSGVAALGHIDNDAAIPAILRYVHHPEKEVRFATACALGSFHSDERVISGLLTLTRDEDAEVRDWAVFALGVLGDADSIKIREAFLTCLTDCRRFRQAQRRQTSSRLDSDARSAGAESASSRSCIWSAWTSQRSTRVGNQRLQRRP